MTFSSDVTQHQAQVPHRACLSSPVSPSIHETNEEMPIVADLPGPGTADPSEVDGNTGVTALRPTPGGSC